MNLGMANGVVPQAMPTMPAMGAMPTAPVGISIYRISRKRKPDSKRWPVLIDRLKPLKKYNVLSSLWLFWQNGMFGGMTTGAQPLPAMMSNPFYNMQPTFTNPLPSQNMLPVQNHVSRNRVDLHDGENVASFKAQKIQAFEIQVCVIVWSRSLLSDNFRCVTNLVPALSISALQCFIVRQRFHSFSRTMEDFFHARTIILFSRSI